MARSSGRPGPEQKWGGTATLPVRYPRAHKEVYTQLAKNLGLSASEYVARVMAGAHGLTFPGEAEEADQQQLPLGA